ncbi:MAG: OsmC family protein [archaeon]
MNDLKVSVQWNGSFRFTSLNEHGHRTEIDATQDGRKPLGVTPMELLLVALGACTGIDIVIILQKQRQKLRIWRLLLVVIKGVKSLAAFKELMWNTC